jgi:hypothetical protein
MKNSVMIMVAIGVGVLLIATMATHKETEKK